MTESDSPNDDELISAAFEEFHNEITSAVDTSHGMAEPSKRRLTQPWIAAAAALVLLAGAGLWWLSDRNDAVVVAGPPTTSASPTNSASGYSDCMWVTVYLDPDATLAQRRAVRDEMAGRAAEVQPVLLDPFDPEDRVIEDAPEGVVSSLEQNEVPVAIRYELQSVRGADGLGDVEALGGVLAVEGPTSLGCSDSDQEAPDAGESRAVELPFQDLGRGDGAETADLVVAVTNQSELNELWSSARVGGPVPAINFGDRFVVAVTVPGIRCQTELSGVSRLGDQIQILFAEPSGCDAPFPLTIHFVALGWSDTGDLVQVNVPAIAEPEFNATEWVERPADAGPFTNEAEDAVIGVLNRLGLQQCCGEPSHGGSDAVIGATWEGTDIPIYVSPLANHTYDVDGEPRVFVPFNDLVTDAAPDTIAGAEVLVGDADLGAFTAFTCGRHIWALGGAGPGDRIESGEVRAFTSAVLSELDCDPGSRPTATGHGNPTGG